MRASCAGPTTSIGVTPTRRAPRGCTRRVSGLAGSVGYSRARRLRGASSTKLRAVPPSRLSTSSYAEHGRVNRHRRIQGRGATLTVLGLPGGGVAAEQVLG